MIAIKNMPQCNSNLADEINIDCASIIHTPQISFKKNRMYQDNKYFGDIIHIDEHTITVKCKKNNKYMNGQIIEIKHNLTFIP